MIGNGHAMGVAAQVVEDLFGTSEGPLGVHHPLDAAKRRQILQESFPVPESLQRGEEPELALVKGGLQAFEEQAPEPAGQHADGQEESRTAGDPAFTIGADAATRYDAMEMGVEKQVLSPTVKDGEEADLGAQVLGIRGNGP